MARKKLTHLYKNTLTRYRLIGAVFVLVLIFVAVNIFNTMFIEGPRWREVASKLRVPEIKPVSPIRGSIFSSDGQVLAISAPTYRLFLDCKSEPIVSLREKHPDSLHMLLDSLAVSLVNHYRYLGNKEITKPKLRQRWQKGFAKGSRHCLLIPVDVGYTDYLFLTSRFPFVVTNRDGKSVSSVLASSITKEEKSVRMKPFGELASRTIGTVYGAAAKGDTVGLSKGKNGLELHCDRYLRGSMGKVLRRYIGGRNTSNVIEAPVPGASVFSTLDMDLQYIVDQSLREKLIETNALRGSVALMEVATGRIVAISNLGRIEQGHYGETQNFIMSDLTEPGSTFKTPVLMAALEDGVVTPDELIETGNGLYKIGRRTIRDHNAHRGGYGTITAEKVLWFSSNVGMVKIAQKGYTHNPSRLTEHLRRYGFMTDLRLEIPGYAIPKVYTPQDTVHRWTQETLQSMAYGYEVQVPPIYTLNYYNAIAGGGRLMRPYLVDRIVDNKGKELYVASPEVLDSVICSPLVLQQIQFMLRDVVQEGTGKPVKSPVISISGKTGTAVLSKGKSGYNSGGRSYMASFCGYFPTEKPKYSCIAIVMEPQGSSSGGYVAGTIVRRIAEQIQQLSRPVILDTIRPIVKNPYSNAMVIGGENSSVSSFLKTHKIKNKVLRSVDPSVPVKVFAEKGTYVLSPSARVGAKEMPNLLGLDPSTAIYELMSRGATVRLVGYGMVVDQSIPEGQTLSPGTLVVLRLAVPVVH